MNKTRQNSDPTILGTSPISKLLIQYSVPAVIASVVTSLYNIIDSAFIGRGVGSMAIAGLAITFPLMNLVVAFCVLIAAGGATISSIFMGQKNIARASEVINNVLTLCIIHSVVFGGLTLIFLDEILLFFGATAETLPYAREFMQVILAGAPISYIFIGLNNLMRATGYPTKAMVSALLSVAVNIILCPIFIFVLEWGIVGAALATICGQSVAFVWVLHHFLSKDSFVHFDRNRKWLTKAVVKRIYSVGMSPFLMNVCGCVVVIVINQALLNSAVGDGNLAVGAYGIINRITMFFVMVVFGIAQGMQPILGFNYGAGNWERVKQTLGKGLKIGGTITAVGWIITELIPDTLSGFFTIDHELIAIARDGFRISFIAFPIVGCQIVITNFFQSIGKPKLSIFLSLTRQLLFLIPFLLILPEFMGIDGVWASMAASDLFAFLVALATLVVMMRRMNHKFSTTSQSPEIKS